MPVPTPTAAAGSVTVDPDRLRELAAALAGVCADLRDRARVYPDVGDPYVTAALRDVQRDWSHARDRICAFLDGVGAAVASAAADYDGAEQALARSAR